MPQQHTDSRSAHNSQQQCNKTKSSVPVFVLNDVLNTRVEYTVHKSMFGVIKKRKTTVPSYETVLYFNRKEETKASGIQKQQKKPIQLNIQQAQHKSSYLPVQSRPIRTKISIKELLNPQPEIFITPNQ